MVVPSRKRKMDRMAIRERKQPRFPKEADLKDVDSYMASLVKWKELTTGIYHDTSAEVLHLLVPIRRMVSPSLRLPFTPRYILPRHHPNGRNYEGLRKRYSCYFDEGIMPNCSCWRRSPSAADELICKQEMDAIKRTPCEQHGKRRKPLPFI